jgi:hypothetical protein
MTLRHAFVILSGPFPVIPSEVEESVSPASAKQTLGEDGFLDKLRMTNREASR